MITNYPFTKVVKAVQLEAEIRSSAIVTALHTILLNGTNDLNIEFKDALSAEDEAILNGLVTAHIPVADVIVPLQVSVNELSAKTSLGVPKMATYEPEGESATIVTHDFTDKCSWYQGSIAVNEEVLNNTSGNIYGSAHQFWIDLQNGRVYDEDNIRAAFPGVYVPEIRIDNVLQTSGYSINYEEGTVTFNEPVVGEVKAKYRYADKSWYIIKPRPGKILSIKAAEVQFSSNIVLPSAFIFEAWFTHPVYGPMAVPGSRITYKNAKDFISACNEGQGVIPKWGGLEYDVHVFPFHYARMKSLKSSIGAEIRVFTSGDLAATGEFGTATFYITVENE